VGTLLRELAADLGATVIDLDELPVRTAVDADPTLYAAVPRPS